MCNDGYFWIGTDPEGAGPSHTRTVLLLVYTKLSAMLPRRYHYRNVSLYQEQNGMAGGCQLEQLGKLRPEDEGRDVVS